MFNKFKLVLILLTFPLLLTSQTESKLDKFFADFANGPDPSSEYGMFVIMDEGYIGGHKTKISYVLYVNKITGQKWIYVDDVTFTNKYSKPIFAPMPNEYVKDLGKVLETKPYEEIKGAEKLKMKRVYDGKILSATDPIADDYYTVFLNEYTDKYWLLIDMGNHFDFYELDGDYSKLKN